MVAHHPTIDMEGIIVKTLIQFSLYDLINFTIIIVMHAILPTTNIGNC